MQLGGKYVRRTPELRHTSYCFLAAVGVYTSSLKYAISISVATYSTKQAAKKVEEVLLGLALLQPSGRMPKRKRKAGAKPASKTSRLGIS